MLPTADVRSEKFSSFEPASWTESIRHAPLSFSAPEESLCAQHGRIPRTANAATQWAGLAALTGPQDDVAKMVAEFDRRRRVVVDGLNKLPGIACATPKGAFYAFPNVTRTGWKAKALASALLDDAGVAIIGGPDFGILGEGYVRLSYANSTENIVRALDRMGEFLGSRQAA